jgi:hypothetical protein
VISVSIVNMFSFEWKNLLCILQCAVDFELSDMSLFHLSALLDLVFTGAGVPAQAGLCGLDISCTVFSFQPALHRFPTWFLRVCFQIRHQVLLSHLCGIIFPLGGFACPRAEHNLISVLGTKFFCLSWLVRTILLEPQFSYHC